MADDVNGYVLKTQLPGAPQPPIIYYPAFVPAPEEAFAALMSLPWCRRKGVFGHDVPRDEIWIGPHDYVYSNRRYPAYDGWTKELIAIKEMVEDNTETRYDSVLCNLYRSGKDSVAEHCDCEREMSGDHPIASISLGAPRLFRMMPKSDKHAATEIELAHGSLLVMLPGMQESWLHCVPKTKAEMGPRINLTFRVMRY